MRKRKGTENEQNEKVECVICDKRFKTEDSLRNHKKSLNHIRKSVSHSTPKIVFKSSAHFHERKSHDTEEEEGEVLIHPPEQELTVNYPEERKELEQQSEQESLQQEEIADEEIEEDFQQLMQQLEEAEQAEHSDNDSLSEVEVDDADESAEEEMENTDSDDANTNNTTATTTESAIPSDTVSSSNDWYPFENYSSAVFFLWTKYTYQTHTAIRSLYKLLQDPKFNLEDLPQNYQKIFDMQNNLPFAQPKEYKVSSDPKDGRKVWMNPIADQLQM